MLKKFSWIAALFVTLAILITGCTNMAIGLDDGSEPIIDDGSFVADEITVEFGATKTVVEVQGGGTVTYEANGSGYTYTYGDASSGTSHGNARAYFKLDLDAARVRNYEKITFDFTPLGGDVDGTGTDDGPKGLNLMASDEALSGYKGDEATMLLFVNPVKPGTPSGPLINESGALVGGTAIGTKKSVEIPISAGRPSSSLRGEVYFSIYLHADAEGGKTKFKIENVVFVPRTGTATAEKVDIDVIPGVAIPVDGEAPVAAITDTTQYTGTVSWADAAGAALTGTFVKGTAYTATITLTAKEGYTFQGVAANFFKVESATAANAVNTGVVTAVFPATKGIATALTITVGDDTQEVALAAVGATYAYTIDEFAYTVTDINYQDKYVYFPVNLGTGKSLADYPFIYVTFKGIQGDIGWKNVWVNVSDTEFSAAFSGPSAANTNGMLPYQAGNTTAVEKFTRLATSSTAFTANGSDLFVAIWMHGGAGTAPNETTYELSNIKFSSGEKVDELDLPVEIVPVAGAEPVYSFESEEGQYTGVITWGGDLEADGTFKFGEVYTAVIELTVVPTVAYKFDGVAANAFKLTGATLTNLANSGTIQASFPRTAALQRVNNFALPTSLIPVATETPIARINTAQYTGTVTYTGTLDSSGKFDFETTYSVSITLSAKTGFTLDGVTGPFTLTGTTVTKSGNTLTASFAKTGDRPSGATVTVGSATQEVLVTALKGGSAEGTITYTADGFRFVQGSGYGPYVLFQVDFGNGKSIADYPNLTLKFKGIAGDIGWKDVRVLVSDATITSVSGSGETAKVYFGTANTNATEGTFDLSGATATSQKPYIAISLWAAGSGDGTNGSQPGTTTWEISDIKFAP